MRQSDNYHYEGRNYDPLRATWSKRESDVMIHYPRKCDGHWLSGIFNQAFINELRGRGYDLTTLRFSVTQFEKQEQP